MALNQTEQVIYEAFRDIGIALRQNGIDPIVALKEVRRWTGNDQELLTAVCNLIEAHKSEIPIGREEESIAFLIRTHLIEAWQTSAIAAHILRIEQQVLAHPKCVLLLKTYRKIVEQTEIAAGHNLIYKDLIQMKLVVAKKGRIKVANEIYRQVFGLDWVEQHLSQLAEPHAATHHALNDRVPDLAPPAPSQTNTYDPTQASPVSRLLSAGALTLTLIAIAFYVVRGNRALEAPQTASTAAPNSASNSATNEPDTLMAPSDSAIVASDPVGLPVECQYDLADITGQIATLQQLQRQPGPDFQEVCQAKLDQLLYNVAIEMATSGQFNTAFGYLCDISAQHNSEPFQEAKFLFETWANNRNTSGQSQEMRPLLISFFQDLENSAGTCPAAKHLNF
jgi:hypothetical protein